MSTITTTPFGIHHSEDCASGQEMLKACGGNFEIEKRQVSYPVVDESATPIGMDGANPVYPTKWVPICAHVPVRSDTGEHIAESTVGDGYVILQNREMIDIANAICGERGLNYEFMTVLDEGRGLAIQVDCPELSKDLNIGKDQNRCRLTMIDWHDGTGSLRLYFSMIRMMCANTLPALGREFARGRRKNRFGFFNIKHTKNMAERIGRAIEIIAEATGDVVQTAEIMRLLADVKCTRGQKTNFFAAIANPEGKDEREMTKRAKTQYETRMQLLEAASKNKVNKVEGYGGSWYETLQAATYYGTHQQTVRGSEEKSAEEKRFTSKNMGSGALTNIRAMELALSMSGVKDKLFVYDAATTESPGKISLARVFA